MKWLDVQNVLPMGVHGKNEHVCIVCFDWKHKNWLAVSAILENGKVLIADDRQVEDGVYSEVTISDKPYDLMSYQHIAEGSVITMT